MPEGAITMRTSFEKAVEYFLMVIDAIYNLLRKIN